MKKLPLLACAIAGLIGGTQAANACTTLLVGDQASTNGAFYMARNEDYMAVWAKHFVLHPRQVNEKGEFHSNTDGFTYPYPKVSLAYTAMQDWDTQDKTMGEVGFNSAGVGMTSTETIFNGKAALAVDPYTKNGINEDSMLNVILPRIHTAKEGVELLGKIIEERGASQGFGVGFIDKTGIWYLETGSGHQWMARKIPNNMYFVSGNQGRLTQYIPNNPDYLASPTLVSFAEQHHLGVVPKAGQPFNFHDAYGITGGQENITYNYPRVWVTQHILNPALKTQVNRDQQDYPVFLKPAHKISLQQVEGIMRNHYQGTDMDPYVNADPVGHYRPISVFRCAESHILEVRPTLPAAIGEIEYINFGMTALGVYIPFYQGTTHIPYGYNLGTDKASDNSIFWKMRKVETLGMLNWKEFHPIIRKAYDHYEAQAAVQQKILEKEYLAIYKKDPQKATQLINQFEQTTTDNVLKVTNELTNELFTKLTQQVDMKSHFAGA